MVRNFSDVVKMAQLLKPQAISADTNTSSFEAAVAQANGFLVQVGTFAFDGSNKIALKVQTSDDDSTWADADASELYSPESGAVQKILDAGTDDDQVYHIEYRGIKRYIRLVLDVTGTVSCLMAVQSLQGYVETKPAA
jgi:hypothetical protein